jgi:hypothetical protein
LIETFDRRGKRRHAVGLTVSVSRVLFLPTPAHIEHLIFEISNRTSAHTRRPVNNSTTID